TVVNLRLLPARLVVTVFERLPGGRRKPLPDVAVLLREEGKGLDGALRGTTDAGGKVSLKVGTPGKYEGMARLKGDKTTTLKTEIRGAGDHRADLELVRALAALTLRVVEGKGKLAAPVANAKVVITQEGRTVQSGSSDPEGNQSFSLPPGVYRVEVT